MNEWVFLMLLPKEAAKTGTQRSLNTQTTGVKHEDKCMQMNKAKKTVFAYCETSMRKSHL